MASRYGLAKLTVAGSLKVSVEANRYCVMMDVVRDFPCDEDQEHRMQTAHPSMDRVSPDSPRQVPAAALPEWPASASSQMASPVVFLDLAGQVDPSLTRGHPASNAHVLAHRVKVPGLDLLCTLTQAWKQDYTVRQPLVCACHSLVPVHLGNDPILEVEVHLVQKPTDQADDDGVHHVDVRCGDGVARHELEEIGALQGVDVDADFVRLSLAVASVRRTRLKHRSPSFVLARPCSH